MDTTIIPNGRALPQLPFDEVAKAALGQALGLLQSWFPAGRLQGHEFMVGDLAGNPGDSLRININTNKWKEFNGGERGGRDLISLRAAKDNISQGDALRAIGDELGINIENRSGGGNGNGSGGKKKDKERPTSVTRYDIKDTTGKVVATHIRREYDRGQDKKPAKDYTWERNGQPGLDGLKVTALPLFGSEAIPKLQAGTTIELCEGETPALALRKRGYIALATVTGASATPEPAVLDTIKHLTVRVWPDNDTPGWNHMRSIARYLVSLGTKVPWVRWEDAPPKGDAADFAGTDEELRALLAKAKPWGTIAPETPASEDGSQPPLQAAKGNGHFLFLGYDDQTYSFFSRRTRQVVHLNIKLLSNKDCLKQLAPLAFWESNFPSRIKSAASWDTESASEYLISGSCGTGRIYDLGGVRGRGAWDDDGKLVLHLGNRLLVDGQQASIADYQFDEAVRRFCYEAGRSIDIQSCDPLTTEQGGQLVDLAGQFLWTNPLPHKLLLGWIVVAPLCGTLKWRPHIWLTGAAGCGKGTVLGYFVKPLMPFRFSNDFTGGTTEAGIRQSLKLDALPAIYDEAESQDDAGRARIQRLLNMLRASSSATERTVKGTTSGKALQYEMRSSFLLSSVILLINQAADRRRIGVLELRMHEDPAQWAGLQKQLAFVTPDMGNALFARTIKLYDVLRQNIAIFGDQIGKHVGANEAGDQYGPLLAGAYLLEHDEPIDPADAYDLVAGYDWAGFGKPEPSERDERLCLDSILGTAVSLANIGGNRTQATLGELIQLMIGAVDDKSFGQVEARAVLRRHGIRIESNEIWIANRSTELDRLVKGPWGVPFADRLKLVNRRHLPQRQHQGLRAVRRDHAAGPGFVF